MSQSVNMTDNANNLNNGNEVSNIPPLPVVEGLCRMIYQLQDHNRKLTTQIEVMNQEYARRENEASSHQNNGDPTGNKEENTTQNT